MMHDRESIERLRRIETRVTKIGRHFGIDVGGGKPVWFAGQGEELARVVIPSPNCSVGAILEVIPQDNRSDETDVYINEQYLFTLFIDP